MKDSRLGAWCDAIAHATFLTLVVLSVKYWQERLIYADSAMQFFEWVQYDELVVQQGYRWSAIVPQLVVKAGSCLGLGLEGLGLSASLSYALWPYLMFLVTRYWMNSPTGAWAMALAMVLFSRHSFYEMVLETQLLAVYPLMLFAWFDSGKRGGWPVGVGCLMLSLLAHPLGAVAGASILVQRFVTRSADRRHAMSLCFVVVGWLTFRHLVLPISSYESTLYENLLAHWQAQRFVDLPQVENLVDHVGRKSTVYLIGVVLASIEVALLIYRNMWLALATFVVVLVVYFVMLAFTYSAGESALMIEKNLIFLGSWISLWLFWTLRGSHFPTMRYAILPLMVAVCFLKLRDVSLVGGQYTRRLDVVEQLTTEASHIGSKVIVERATVKEAGIWVEWALPFETLLISALKHQNVTTVVCSDEIPSGSGLDGRQLILPYTSQRLGPQDLDSRYFACDDVEYRVLSSFHVASPK